MGTHVNDCKRDALATLLVQPELNIDDLEQDYLSLLGATSPHANDGWLEVFALNGATSTQFNAAAAEFFVEQGAPNDNVADNWKWFWCVQGGVVVTDNINVKDSDGNSLETPLVVYNSVGLPFTITNVVRDSDGNLITVS